MLTLLWTHSGDHPPWCRHCRGPVPGDSREHLISSHCTHSFGLLQVSAQVETGVRTVWVRVHTPAEVVRTPLLEEQPHHGHSWGASQHREHSLAVMVMKARPEGDLSLKLQDHPGQHHDTSERHLKRCPLREQGGGRGRQDQ